MTNPRLDDKVDVSRYVAETAARLSGRLAEVSSHIRRSLEEDIPELRGDPGVAELLGASVEGNVDTILHALRYDIAVQRVEAPTAAMEYARRLAQRGVPVNALIRAYRLGQRRMNELVFGEVRALDIEPSMGFAVIEAIAATLFEYIDWISQQVVVVYEDERERWLENQNSIRALRVREVLAGKKAIDVDTATDAIRYPIRWHHLAVVVWYPDAAGGGNELTLLQRFVRDLGEAADTAAAPLFVAADRMCGWGWLPFRTPAADALDKVRRFTAGHRGAPSVGIGMMAPGVEGFRRSHQQAQAARAVAVARGGHEPTVIAASDPGLSAAALLSGDVGQARDWVAEVLGDLAADNENDARLRHTLRIFLRCGSSYKVAAEELRLHSNSVKYRVGRAIARRGRPIAGDRLDVELALLVCHWYGTAVLSRDPG
ncbi:helix-turn-helix domain-containing protein [Mycobacterium sp.]|uniref:helix-turn-helix domain-containing protein n=1 Tax=Mycobacterium sp. TaxID=1785 RepID=UPI002C7018E6|nr:helix-turn-helix domain-containing protein [Mycobacterium sp.]HME46816.1 helix-turn-helix domain-containing protein [Mycobacterium sp.]